MANPWDPLPLPILGNHDEGVLFAALGRTLNRWEYIEVGLSILFSLFAGDPSFTKMQAYGASGKIFRNRLDGLKRAADGWFARSPSQEIEGEFDKLVTAAGGFADRRNEVAHGLVMDASVFLFWREKMILASPNRPQFLVIPPYYLVSRHNDLTGMPDYGYSSIELDALDERLIDFEIEVDSFTHRLWPGQWPSAYSAPSHGTCRA
ncbi:hypothetical protein ACG873_05995 [Mesorhizobium sp. AaZ16]|uniref:hypothetical protein n=1 Tax=Mesorhizobium sp. AaZ16 TaxID=3402289 RepID=UPI00374ECD63